MDAPTHPQLLPSQDTPSDAALWYMDAVIYQLNVKAFFDSNDDGMGDFRGVAAKLDYVKELGVNTIWLMPFYPSPLRDDGYDIAGYDDVHPQYGTLDDFKLMLAEAHKRDLKVITELVINHTSDQHPWFQRARKAPPGSPERNFYVWSDDPEKYAGTRIIFTDTETSNWTWDPVAKAYFWHRFFSHQPDLNFDNPAVLEAVFKTMRFWLDMGVDGFRLDAIPYLIEREGTNNENLPETHAVIKQLRAAIDAQYANRFLLAEANQWPEDVRDYFGEGDECHACYHFPLMPRIYMAIAQEDRFPVTEIMEQTPEIPPTCQWAIFLRNHDELTLEMVTSKERDYMYSTYASDPRARINLGIRRRLAPLMDNDLDRIKLMNALLLSMRGSPIIYYGDEIGMGDNFFVGDRNGVRTPMQWSFDRNAGFSRADPQRLYLPPIMDSVYGFQAVNVESQQRDPSSLLNWMRRMLTTRGAHRAFGRGELLFLKPGNRKILAYLRVLTTSPAETIGEVILCVFNLGRSAQPVELDLSAFKGRVPVELLGRAAFPPIGELPYLLTIPAHGFYWFRLSSDAPAPAWHEALTPAEDRPVLVLFDGWLSFFREQAVPWRMGLATRTRNAFEADVLPSHVQTQRWFAMKDRRIERARLVDQAIWSAAAAEGETQAPSIAGTGGPGRAGWLLPIVALDLAQTHEAPNYFVPLAMAWEDIDDERSRAALAATAVARVRQQAATGVMGDAFADERFARAVLGAMAAGSELATSRGKLRFSTTRAFAGIVGADDAAGARAALAALPVGRPQGQSSNTVVTFGERVFLKGYRRLRAGMNPEFEVGRFLTEVARFPHAVPVAGVLEYAGDDGTLMTLAIAQGYVENQGDGWSWALDHLSRHLEALRDGAAGTEDVHLLFVERIATLGRRTGELHAALAAPAGDAAFEPEPLGAADVAADQRSVADQLAAVLMQLQGALDAGTLVPAAVEPARRLLAARARLVARIDRIEAPGTHSRRTRFHGDYHLGQVLVVKNDFVLIDFEGEPGRGFEERRAKRSPLVDVAGMLRSFDYAAISALRAAARTPEEAAALAPVAAQWQGRVREAFLAGYRESAPPEATAAAGLLELYELHKAVYELGYELGNRPDWVEIPVQGLLRMT
ncbi:MAG TPA: maltose alpha-D-glucosyltransferase [Methylibium sp.]|uniref:maltose alpha-D-glucosyltransferase n=1 Tax=Methylibium sp. TaxID=2067992 RepID=UPI002DB6DA46|nr:maltose alpha-D-glucosyltransferase [Methylibium sp.]HEU4460348.1 maltose alpha-D-glucosyltransferase [Methylibium sp.]